MSDTQSYHLGILGYPLGHSLSGVLQPYYLEMAGLQGDYTKMEIPPEAFDEWVVAEKQTPRLGGFNITIPYKVRILPQIDELSEEACLIGAVNTVCSSPSGWRGHNTDAFGFMAPLDEERRKGLRDAEVLIIGAGGAARAVAFGLLKAHPRRVTFWVRNLNRAAETTNCVTRMNEVLTQDKTEIRWVDTLTPQEMSSVTFVVNTSPVGMSPQVEASPLEFEWIEALPSEALVYDLVYNPLETKLLSDARRRGLAVQDGLDMLLYQGARAFILWTGVDLSDQVIQGARKTVLSRVGIPSS